MTRIVCFTDTPALAYGIRHAFAETGTDVQTMSASRLNSETRDAVCALKPDLVLFEMTRSLDNAHIFFFLRADATTRDLPIVMISAGARLEHQAQILGANGYVQFPFATEALATYLSSFLPAATAAA